MEYIVAAYTDAGIQQKTNQDSLCLRRAVVPEYGEVLLAVICDGMGGLEKGELASAECIRAFSRWFDQNLQQLPTLCKNDFAIAKEQWRSLLSAVHLQLLQYAAKTHVILGTTLAAIMTWGDRYLVANVGDSRIYECGQELSLLTRDQSLVATEVAMGRITAEEARHHPQRNILLQCIGTGDHLAPLLDTGTLKSNAFYLLCTDGFWHELSPLELKEQLSSLIITSKDQMSPVLQRLTELCKERGETDNITSLLIRASESTLKLCHPQGIFSLAKQLFPKKAPSLSPPLTLVETAQLVHTDETI